MSEMTNEQLDAIERAAKSATPGPWKDVPTSGGNRFWSMITADTPDIKGLVLAEVQNLRHTDVPGQTKLSNVNAEYIAVVSPDVALALVAALRAARAEIAALRAIFGPLSSDAANAGDGGGDAG